MTRRRIALAVLALTCACARTTPAQTPRFEDEIKAFEAADRASPPAPGGIVLVGSSSFRMWRDVNAAFPGVNVINRGFGGSIMPEVVHYAPRIVLPYKPRLVLVYAGDNDLNDGRTPAQVLADYNAFVALVHRALPRTRIAFVSIKPSPSRWKIVDSMRVANALVRGAVSRDSLQAYVDVFTPMLGANGRPRAELFIADSLHMTPAGYAVWRERLATVIR
jgi:lysophospholipase L1-like esterase